MLIASIVILGQLLVGQQKNATLVIDGYPGQARVTDINGTPFVDLRALAHITNSTVTFEADRVVLSPSFGTRSAAARRLERSFSREFMNAAIESIASMREWTTTLAVAIQYGVPIGNATVPYRGRAVDALHFATAAAATPADHDGLELLKREFGNVDAWSRTLASTRNSLSAANLVMSEDALRSDPTVQNIARCSQLLGPMFASGTFQDDGSCR
jgi:hypothetical protein